MIARLSAKRWETLVTLVLPPVSIARLPFLEEWTQYRLEHASDEKAKVVAVALASGQTTQLLYYHNRESFDEEAIRRIQAFRKHLADEYLLAIGVELAHQRDPRDEFTVEFPGALSVCFVNLATEADQTEVDAETTFTEYRHFGFPLQMIWLAKGSCLLTRITVGSGWVTPRGAGRAFDHRIARGNLLAVMTCAAGSVGSMRRADACLLRPKNCLPRDGKV